MLPGAGVCGGGGGGGSGGCGGGGGVRAGVGVVVAVAVARSSVSWPQQSVFVAASAPKPLLGAITPAAPRKGATRRGRWAPMGTRDMPGGCAASASPRSVRTKRLRRTSARARRRLVDNGGTSGCAKGVPTGCKLAGHGRRVVSPRTHCGVASPHPVDASFAPPSLAQCSPRHPPDQSPCSFDGRRGQAVIRTKPVRGLVDFSRPVPLVDVHDPPSTPQSGTWPRHEQLPCPRNFNYGRQQPWGSSRIRMDAHI